MRLKDNAKRSKRRKIAWAAIALLLVVGTGRFLVMRAADRDGWPEPAPGVVFDPAGGRDAEGALASPEDFAPIVAGLPAPGPALVAEYHAYQARGFAPDATYPLIEARLQETESARQTFAAILGASDGLDPSAGSVAYNAVAGRSAEITLLGCYSAAAALRQETNAAPAAIRFSLLDQALKLTRGAGLLGRAAALNNAMLVVREDIMSPPAWPDREACAAHVARIRALEANLGELDDALRADWVSIRLSIAAMYAQMAQTNAPSAPPGRRLSGKSAFFVNLLGGSEAGTRANLDALLSRLVQNAAAPYAQNGLSAGLPVWCRGTSRPPWTRDPIGSAVASAYLKNAALGHAAGPGLLLELRAARTVAALQWQRQSFGAYPESLDALLASGLLEEADVLDPFSRGGAARLSYRRDGDGWRLHGVGLDQEDGGGLVDAYRTTDAKTRSAADFVFVSREREVRLASYAAAQPPAAPAASGKGN